MVTLSTEIIYNKCIRMSMEEGQPSVFKRWADPSISQTDGGSGN